MDTSEKCDIFKMHCDCDQPMLEQIFPNDDSNCKEILKALNGQRNVSENEEDCSFCDVVLVVEDSRFPAHRCVLAANSLYFKAMFGGRRFLEGNAREITLQDVSKDAVAILLDVMYGGSIRLNTETVYGILEAADLFLMDKVKLSCVEFLSLILTSVMSHKEVIKIWKVGQLFNITDLVNSANKILQEEFRSVYKKADAFLELNYQEIDRIVSSDSISCEEHVIFKAVIYWIKHDLSQRSQYLNSLMEKVRFPLIDPKKLFTLVAKEELITKSDVCLNLLDEAKQYMLLPKRQCFLQSSRTQPRFPENSSLIYVLSGLQHFKCYVPDRQKWYSLQVPHFATTKKQKSQSIHASLVCVNSSVFCAISNGFKDEVGRYSLIQLQKFEISQNQWNVCSMPSSCIDVTLVEGNDSLYACTRDSLEVYDKMADSWSCVTKWQLDPYQFLVMDDEVFHFFNFGEGVVQEVDLENLKVKKHQVFIPNQFIVAVQNVVKLGSHQVFIVLRTLTGITRKIFNIKSYQWKDANFNTKQKQHLLPFSLDHAVYHVTYDRSDDLMFILFNSPYPSRHVNNPECLEDAVLPFFSVEPWNGGRWTRMPSLPEYMSNDAINVCITDNMSSVSAT